MASVDFGRYKRLVQAFWDPEPRNDDIVDSCIWCLGKRYVSKLPFGGENVQTPALVHSIPLVGHDGDYHEHEHQNQEESLTVTSPQETKKTLESEVDRGWPSEFLDDCESRLWFTYRSNFPPIKRSSDASMTLSVRLRSLGDQGSFTSDTGWGCMIRSGQSLLANALAVLHLGRDWRRGSMREQENRLVSLFADDPSAPFSIHRFVEYGASSCGKHPGEWFGPSATARCIQSLSQEHHAAGLNVYVNGDGADVYEDRVFKLAKSPHGVFTPTLILVGIRLGIDRVTPVYSDALKALLQLPQSVGIAGGRPSSSHYFFGIQGDHFFYLDPHITQSALQLPKETSTLSNEEVDSCHTRRLRRLPLKEMDPSMLIAFLIKDEKDWKKWRSAISQTLGKPVVHVSDKEPSLHGQGLERPSAVDDVETFDDDDDERDRDGEWIEHPKQ